MQCFQRKINLAVGDGVFLFGNGFFVLRGVQNVDKDHGRNAVKLELRIDHFAKRVFFPIVAKPKSGNGFRVGVAHDRFVHRPADGMYRRGSDNERNAGIRFNRGRNGRVNLSCRYAVIIVSHGYTSLPLRIAEAMSE